MKKIPYPSKNPFTWIFWVVSCPNYTYEVKKKNLHAVCCVACMSAVAERCCLPLVTDGCFAWSDVADIIACRAQWWHKLARGHPRPGAASASLITLTAKLNLFISLNSGDLTTRITLCFGLCVFSV